MSNYPVSSTITLEASTPFTGKLSTAGSVVVLRDAQGIATQSVYSDGFPANQPIIIPTDTLIIPSGMLTSVMPRFGRNTAAPGYKPPVISIIPFGGSAPMVVSQASADLNAVVFAQSPVSGGIPQTFHSVSKLWPLLDTTFQNLIANAAAIPSAPPMLPRFQTLVNGLLSQLSSYSKVFDGAFPGSTITGTKVYKTSPTNQPSTLIGDATGTTDTLLVCVGDVTIGSVTAGTGGFTVILATGKVTLTTTPASPPIGSAIVIIGLNGVYKADMTTLYTSSDLTGLSRIIMATSDTAVNALNTSGMLYFSGTPATYFAVPASAVSYPLGVPKVAKLTMLDDVFTGMFPNSTAATLGYNGIYNSIASTASYFAFPLTTSVLPSDLDVEAFLRLQIAVQFQVSSIDSVMSTGPGTFMVEFTANGESHQSAFLIQQSSGSLPNAGVATGAHRFDDYVLPVMAQTYRVSEDGFAFWKSGCYITLNKFGNFVMSTDTSAQLSNVPSANPGYLLVKLADLGVGEYVLGDSAGTVIKADRSVDVTSPFPTSAFTGGVDRYITNEDGTYSSHYTHLAPQPVTVPGAKVSLVGMPYESFLRYQPLNGRVVSVLPGTGLSATGGSLLVVSGNRRTKRVTAVCKVQPTWDSGLTATLRVGENVRHLYNYDTTKVLVVYANQSQIDVLYRTSTGVDAFATLRKGDEGIDLFGNGDLYIYDVNLTTNIATLSKTTTPTTVWSSTLLTAAPTVSDLMLDIVFGDMVQAEIPDTLVLSDEPFDYLARDINGLVGHQQQPLTILGTTNTFDATCRGPEELNGLAAGGFVVPPYVDNEYRIVKRARAESDPVIIDHIVAFGRKLVAYEPDVDLVSVGLLPGSYERADASGIVDVDENGNVDITVTPLPFSIASMTFVGILAPPQEPPGVFFHMTAVDVLATIGKMPRGSSIATEGTTAKWTCNLDATDGTYSLFLLISANVGDRIVMMAGTQPHTYILTSAYP